MPITLKPEAAEEIRSITKDQGLDLQTSRLRVGVKGHGSQRQFSLDLTEDANDDDVTFSSEGITIVCAPEDVPVLGEAVIDFQRNAAYGAGFTFKVPDEKHVTHGEYDKDAELPTKHQVYGALYHVDDPEVGVNIVDLGLVYGLEVEERNVKLRITMTTPACPLSEHIRGEINQRVREMCPGVDAIDITIVWEPKWTSEMMSDAGKEQLGWSR
ncbi:MAG: DUF59 domain-containing protein [Phycisphaerales bacterium]|nr:DUF59 domain-containing protein [Phycisphaerales bacterium]